MNYIDTNLLPGETVIQRAVISPVGAYMPGCVFLFGSAGIGFFLALLGGASIGVLIFVIGAIASVPLFLGGWYRIANTEFALTSRRVIAKEGWLKKRSFDVMLAKIEGVHVHQNIFGSLFGYGDITVGGTGGSREPFKAIADPLNFRHAIQVKLETLEAQN